MKSSNHIPSDRFSLVSAARWLTFAAGAVGFALLAYSALSRTSRDDGAAVSVTPTATAKADKQPSSPGATTRPIEQLKVGDRVLARNPEVTQEERAAYVEPDWSEWVHLSLEMPKPDGYVLRIEMLRPESWVRSQLALVTAKRQSDDPAKPFSDRSTNTAETIASSTATPGTMESSSAEASAPEGLGFLPYRRLYLDLAATSAAIETETDEVIGAVVELDLPELGLTGPAIINNIETAPEVKRGEGRVITATFHHSSGDVIDLVIGDDKSTESIGTTSNHPFWSVDRQEYVQAGSLRQGERVLTLHGETKRIVSHFARPGPQPVFNLEVFAEHVYYVGGDGLLVHNSGPYNKIDDVAPVKPDIKTGTGYGVSDPPVRIQGNWTDSDLKQALLGHPPRGLGSPDLHHAGQMPGAGIHEVIPGQHRGNKALHPNKYNQGVTAELREQDRQLHWWYRAREQGADQRLPNWIYDK
ncbi:MAG: polymorphic toxin-type HINT domain-containing protein [Pirellulales bacterium]